MEKKYIIIRLDDNRYWGFGDWTSEISQAQAFENREWAEQRIKHKDLFSQDAMANEFFQIGNFFEVREIWAKK